MDYETFQSRALPAGLLQRIERANVELEANERSFQPIPAYDRLSSDANERGLMFRKQLAEAIYLHGSAVLRSSRAHDNCFENGDGAEVVAHLVARARRNPALWNAIARDFGGAFPASWLGRAPAQGVLALAV